MKKGGQPKKLDTIVLLVNDLEKSADFYGNILKLSLKLKSPTWAEFVVDDLHIALHQKSREECAREIPGGGYNIAIQFEVDNIEDHVAFLQLHGVELIGGIQDSTFARFAFFIDPDGHILGLREYRQTSTPAY